MQTVITHLTSDTPLDVIRHPPFPRYCILYSLCVSTSHDVFCRARIQGTNAHSNYRTFSFSILCIACICMSKAAKQRGLPTSGTNYQHGPDSNFSAEYSAPSSQCTSFLRTPSYTTALCMCCSFQKPVRPQDQDSDGHGGHHQMVERAPKTQGRNSSNIRKLRKSRTKPDARVPVPVQPQGEQPYTRGITYPDEGAIQLQILN